MSFLLSKDKFSTFKEKIKNKCSTSTYIFTEHINFNDENAIAHLLVKFRICDSSDEREIFCSRLEI